MKKQIKAISAITGLFFGGCTLGPDYVQPAPPAIQTYTENPSAELALSLSTVQAVDPQWWRIYQCDPLNTLVERALQNNPTLDSAKNTLLAVQNIYQAQAGVIYYPSIDGHASVVRQRVNLESLGITAFPNPPPFTLYTVGATLSYTFDLFGANRRQLEALGAQVNYQEFELIASHISIATNVVSSIIQMASLHEQVCITQELLALQKEQLAIMEKQLCVGGVSEHDVIQKRVQIEETTAQLMPLEKQLAQTRHQIAIYLGEPPETACIPTIRLADLALPTTLPMSVPADLIQQRPDIQASGALLHVSYALVGIATANLLPNITITGNLNTQTIFFEQLFGSGTGAWAIGPGLTQPIFHGGQLRAERRAAIAAMETAEANYKNTVLVAIQNVADTLKAIEFDGKTLAARCEATAQAQHDYEIAARQFEVGSKSQFGLLDAKQVLDQQILAKAPIMANQLTDTAALYQALGGGWWNAAPCAATSVTTAAIDSATD